MGSAKFGIDERVWGEVIGEQRVRPALIALAGSACLEVLNKGLGDIPGDKIGLRERVI